MKTLLRNALVMCMIATAITSTVDAACKNGVCAMRKPVVVRKADAKKIAKLKTKVAKAASKMVAKKRQLKRAIQTAVRRGGCRNGRCRR